MMFTSTFHGLHCSTRFPKASQRYTFSPRWEQRPQFELSFVVFQFVILRFSQRIGSTSDCKRRAMRKAMQQYNHAVHIIVLALSGFFTTTQSQKRAEVRTYATSALSKDKRRIQEHPKYIGLEDNRARLNERIHESGQFHSVHYYPS